MITSSKSSIRRIIALPSKLIEELEQLVEQKVISCVDCGICEAVEHYLAQSKHEQYNRQIIEAAKDHRYMERTLDMQVSFRHVDFEVRVQ